MKSICCPILTILLISFVLSKNTSPVCYDPLCDACMPDNIYVCLNCKERCANLKGKCF